jgi:tetratricopeptide (TPR) repeat protein
VACGPSPQKPKVPEKPPEPPKPKVINGHIPLKAYNQFKAGVVLLKAKPVKYNQAITEFQTAINTYEAFHKEKGQAKTYIIAQLNIAYSYEQLGRYNDAVKAYVKLRSLNVSDLGVQLAYGRSLLLSGKPDAAIKEFDTVLKKSPRNLRAMNNMAAAHLNKKDFKTCLK